MSLITVSRRIIQQRGLANQIAKKIDVVKTPTISFSAPKSTNIVPEKRSFLTDAKNYFCNLFRRKPKVKLEPFSKLEPAKIMHKEGTSPIIHSKQTYNYIDCDNARIMSSRKPVTLKKAELPKDKTILNVSNFDYPSGSIAATTELNECIATGKLLQCAGVAVVDKANNMQTLIHCFPGQSYEDIVNLLKHTVSKNNRNLDITVISGTDDCCDKTISAIVDGLKKVAPSNKIKFANFSKDVRIFDRAVVLQNGKLTCCANTELEQAANKVTNPMDRITYIVDKYNS